MTKKRTKKGLKFVTRNDFENVKVTLSTVDLFPLKSLNLDFGFWVDSTWGRDKKNLQLHFKEVKKMIHIFTQIPFFKDVFISIANIPEQMTHDKAYICYEFTLFTNCEFDNPRLEIPLLFYDLIDEICFQKFLSNPHFYIQR